MMAQSQVCDLALADQDLLADVVSFTKLFFPSAWAGYGDAIFGNLKLMPIEQSLLAITSDYQQMQPMFFSEPPSLNVILNELQGLEASINEQ